VWRYYFIHALFNWKTNSLSSSWNPLLSYLAYPVLGPLNLVYALLIISPCMCEDYPNLKMEAAGSSLPNYEPFHPKRPTSISCKCTYRRAPVITSERVISCHLSLRKRDQELSRFKQICQIKTTLTLCNLYGWY